MLIKSGDKKWNAAKHVVAPLDRIVTMLVSVSKVYTTTTTTPWSECPLPAERARMVVDLEVTPGVSDSNAEIGGLDRLRGVPVDSTTPIGMTIEA